ncbi:RNA ligase family protein [Hydrogenophaga sp. 2FB]|uniref:RNA ligase family protein n=1 Tax=Hydrogenophaga sp. 2FB TaxID=2502187 RepID=UPI0014850420|nr:RNA ligase family protein [Hydrogenophaga sp. 2FB]
MTTQNQEKSIFLFMTEGSSDKEYHVHLRTQGDGWVVQAANGPRGRVGKTSLRTHSPVDYAAACDVYDSLVKAKKKKGYTEAESGIRFTNYEGTAAPSGHVQQLPTPVDRAGAGRMIFDDRFGMQEKANGERCSIEVRNGVARGINKLGLYRNLPENIAEEMGGFQNAFFDGEIVGNTYYAFDLLDYVGDDLRGKPFAERYEALANDALESLFMVPHSCVKLLQCSFTTVAKSEKLKSIEETNAEGVVFKDVTAPYAGGRSDNVFKFKLIESATCIVTGINTGRSVGIGLLNASLELLPVGNVTILANFSMPAVGDLAEVQYLYFNPGGAFEQPVYLGPRSDIATNECLITQVSRLKPGVSMDDMGRRISGADSIVATASAPAARRARI